MCAFVVAAAELVARARGFGNPVLYQVGPAYEYMIRPTQRLRRNQCDVYINALGMRSAEISEFPGRDVTRLLCLGDSITFGGTWSTQYKTFPSVLQELLDSSGQTGKYEVLNASAPGWAPENEIGFVRTFGTFNSHVLLLEVGTNDLFLPASLPVAVNMPEKRPYCALQEIAVKTLWNRQQRPQPTPSGEDYWRQFEKNIVAWKEILEIAMTNGCRVGVLYVKHRGNIDPVLIDRGEESLLNFLREAGVPYASAAKRFEELGADHLFRDGIHPNETGNRVLAECAYELVESIKG